MHVMRGDLPRGGSYDPLPRGSLQVSAARELIVTRSAAGAYERDGTVARDTLWAMLESAFTRPTKPAPAGGDVVDVEEEDVVWGGHVIDHYGHFLTDSVARLWPLLPGGPLEGMPVVLTTPRRSRYVLEWLDAFGAPVVELPAQGAVRFKRMYVPQPALRHSAWIAPELRDVHLRTREGLNVPADRGHDLLWLSRTRLGRDHTAYDEHLLEWLLADRLAIVHPEAMSLAEQVSALENSRAVAGVIGSAFHTLLLAADTPECLYLCPPWERPAYPAQHCLLGGAAAFSWALSIAARRRRIREELVFPATYRIHIPEALRALEASVAPGLLEDPRLAAFAEPTEAEAGASPIDRAVASVLLEPLAIEPRLTLATAFEAEGLAECALEQRMAAADLSDDFPAARATDPAASTAGA